jgi:hypothetical protein
MKHDARRLEYNQQTPTNQVGNNNHPYDEEQYHVIPEQQHAAFRNVYAYL